MVLISPGQQSLALLRLCFSGASNLSDFLLVLVDVTWLVSRLQLGVAAVQGEMDVRFTDSTVACVSLGMWNGWGTEPVWTLRFYGIAVPV